MSRLDPIPCGRSAPGNPPAIAVVLLGCLLSFLLLGSTVRIAAGQEAREGSTRESPSDRLGFLRLYDRDGDGILTRGEYPGPGETFARLDVNRDGKVTPQEVDGPRSRVRRSGATHVRVERVVEALRRYDENHDGRVSRAEWKGAAGGFRRLDRDEDGIITFEDAFASRGDARVPRRLHRPDDGAEMSRLDRNHDRRIDREEWKGGTERFLAADVDGDGFLDAMELREWLRKGWLRKLEVYGDVTFFQRWDRDGNRSVTRREWDGPPEVFWRLDRNGDGRVTVADS